MSRPWSIATSTALAAALVAVALGARGGTALERTGIVEIALLAVAAAVIVAAILLAPRGRVPATAGPTSDTSRPKSAQHEPDAQAVAGGPGSAAFRPESAQGSEPSRPRLHGGWALAAFAALAGITALSIGWSISPHASYVETGRTLAYLAVFAAAVVGARLAPGAAPAVLRGVLAAAVAIAAYGLAARVWPAEFSEGLLTGRISIPYDYWNALAGTAAFGIVPAVWLGARRSGHALARAGAYPAAGLLIATVLISQSRGALLGGAIACALWIAVVPLRLRSLAVLGAGAAGAAPVAAWALSKEAFRVGGQPLAAREAVAGDFGLLLAAMVVGLAAVGVAAVTLQARRPLDLQARWRAGVAIAAVAALVPLALLISVATSERGLAGTVSDRVDELTTDGGATPTGGERLTSVSSSRAGYWGEAWKAFEERPLTGLGADSFALSRLRYRDDGLRVAHAHGFLPQTLGDLGLLGLAAALALLAAWAAAAMRSTALGPRRWAAEGQARAAPSGASPASHQGRARRPPWTTERAALVALALAVIAYGVQSTIDWTWFIPGITVMALVAAGFVAGRGPLRRQGEVTERTPLERSGDVAAPAVPAGSSATWTTDDAAEPSRRRPRLSPPRIAAASGVAFGALLAAWVVWQPVAADRAVARSYELLDAGRPAAALSEAESAREHNPYSPEPLYAEADALAELGRGGAGLDALREAVGEHRRDPDAWIRLATFALNRLDAPRSALDMTEIALRLDPHSSTAATVRDSAQAELDRRDAASHAAEPVLGAPDTVLTTAQP